ncbi:unnamed protein product [Rotaria sordida]|uniref:Cytochrome P450 n=1 Tax=Rotaria sordida TaxID=392033 RepID=A0A814VZV9_9BILA|nr:unnamed protein product [Rotaria sordida]CAF1194277.1 unnamed protein product [Rotaria sordida]CAF1209327.1 unnamed protein product [Rotaria sordida]
MLLFLVASFETISNALSSFIHLINALIKEVLHFSPPSSGTVRTLTINDYLLHSGFHLYKGEQIIILFYNLARNQRYWKIDPNIFYPERFLNEDQEPLSICIYSFW